MYNTSTTDNKLGANIRYERRGGKISGLMVTPKYRIRWVKNEEIAVEGMGNGKPVTNISEFKQRCGDLIQEYAQEFDIHPNLLGAIVFTESNGAGYYDNSKLKIRFENHICIDWFDNEKYKKFLGIRK
ncbi:N-acetylmuramidase domain-containing protein [Natranaerovirga hydrolytica]|uniref:N-acetylmuramidase domain-containing protein n=1 Tax=Natranaerovirga hydrolytica TaxID=680378 RepID=UPI001048651F|nr:N-acetylmuramidase domain-containing protein [Natranaerovirga hydrolytica]